MRAVKLVVGILVLWAAVTGLLVAIALSAAADARAGAVRAGRGDRDLSGHTEPQEPVAVVEVPPRFHIWNAQVVDSQFYLYLVNDHVAGRCFVVARSAHGMSIAPTPCQ